MSSKSLRATLTIELKNSEIARALYKTLLPETRSLPRDERSNVVCDLRDSGVVLVFEATDISALRAVLNSFLYLIHACLSSLSNIEHVEVSFKNG